MRTGAIRILFDFANLLTQNSYDVYVYYTLFPFKQKNKWTLRSYLGKLRNKYFELMSTKRNLKNFGTVNFKVKLIPFISKWFMRKPDSTIYTYWPISLSLNKLAWDKKKIFYLIQAYETWDADIELLHNTYNMGFINLAVSEHLKKFLKSNFNADSIVIKNGIDYNKFYIENEDRFKFTDGRITFIYYPMEFKGTETIIEAIEKVYRKYPEIKVQCYGMNLPKSLPVFISYTHDPSDSQIRKILNETDIFIAASFEEGFYLTPAEAMACGCAVITSNVGAINEYSKNMEDSLHFEPGNVQQLINALEYLLNNKNELKKIAMNGSKNIKENLNWEKSFNLLNDLLKK